MRTCLGLLSSTEDRALRFMRCQARCSPRARQWVWPFEGAIHRICILGEHQGINQWLSIAPTAKPLPASAGSLPCHHVHPVGFGQHHRPHTRVRATHHVSCRARFTRPEAHCVWTKWSCSEAAATRAGAWRPFCLTTVSGCDTILRNSARHTELACVGVTSLPSRAISSVG